MHFVTNALHIHPYALALSQTLYCVFVDFAQHNQINIIAQQIPKRFLNLQTPYVPTHKIEQKCLLTLS